MSLFSSAAAGFSARVKKLFNPSRIKTENFVFILHQQWTFLIVIVGLIFSSSNNYLNKDAIVCADDKDTPYFRDFCFLHGGSHVHKAIQGEVSSGTQCASIAKDGDNNDLDRRTRYYIWLPFVFAIVAIVTKIPGILWKNILERNTMENLVAELDQEGANKEVALQRIANMVKGAETSLQAIVYNFGFAFCELLNLGSICVSWILLNSLLNHEFANYGFNVHTHRSFVGNPSLPELELPNNPMCQLFPTEISCSVSTGAISGGSNKENFVCLLPNNLFYQYYFLILWCWWVALVFVTCAALVYRIAQILIPQLGR